MFANKSCLNIVNEEFIFVILRNNNNNNKENNSNDYKGLGSGSRMITKKRQQHKHDKY